MTYSSRVDAPTNSQIPILTQDVTAVKIITDCLSDTKKQFMPNPDATVLNFSPIL